MNVQLQQSLQPLRSLQSVRGAAAAAAASCKRNVVLLLLGATVLGSAFAEQPQPLQAPTARLEATQADEPSEQALALAGQGGLPFMTLADSGPERLIQILTLLAVLSAASTTCAVMATKLMARRAARAARSQAPVPGRGVAVPTGQPLQGAGAHRVTRPPTAAAPAPVPVSKRSLTEA